MDLSQYFVDVDGIAFLPLLPAFLVGASLGFRLADGLFGAFAAYC